MSVTVYTKPACVQCNATYRALNKAGIAYSTVDLVEDEAALDRLKELGFQGAPVVESPIGAWAGFNPDKILELSDYFQSES